MAAGQVRRKRWRIEVLAEAQRLAGDMSEAEGRLVTVDEYLDLMAQAGMRGARTCVACRAKMRCSVHGPDPAQAPKGKAPVEKPVHVRYAEAYAEGQRKASGAHFAVPGAGEKMALIQMATVHARYSESAPEAGQRMTGDLLLDWFRATSAEFRRTMASEALYTFTPRRCLAWLDAKRPSPKAAAPKRLSTRQAAPSLEGRVSE